MRAALYIKKRKRYEWQKRKQYWAFTITKQFRMVAYHYFFMTGSQTITLIDRLLHKRILRSLRRRANIVAPMGAATGRVDFDQLECVLSNDIAGSRQTYVWWKHTYKEWSIRIGLNHRQDRKTSDFFPWRFFFLFKNELASIWHTGQPASSINFN